MAKNQSLPAHLQEKDSKGEENLTLYEHHEKPTIWWPRPSLSNPRSTNEIVWAFLRVNPTLLRFVTNRVLTPLIEILSKKNLKKNLYMFIHFKFIPNPLEVGSIPHGLFLLVFFIIILFCGLA